eukprot:3600177-Rhodomonas_salina.3
MDFLALSSKDFLASELDLRDRVSELARDIPGGFWHSTHHCHHLRKDCFVMSGPHCTFEGRVECRAEVLRKGTSEHGSGQDGAHCLNSH